MQLTQEHSKGYQELDINGIASPVVQGLPRVRYKWNSLTSRSVSLTCPKQQLNTCSFYGPFNIVPTEVQQ